MLSFFETPVTVIHLFCCFFLGLIILIQPGRSGGLGAAFGGAGGQQVFGGRGAGDLLSKVTWVTATIFFLTSMVLAYMSSSATDTLEKPEPPFVATELPPAVIEAPPTLPTPTPVTDEASETEAAAATDAGAAATDEGAGAAEAPAPNVDDAPAPTPDGEAEAPAPAKQPSDSATPDTGN